MRSIMKYTVRTLVWKCYCSGTRASMRFRAGHVGDFKRKGAPRAPFVVLRPALIPSRHRPSNGCQHSGVSLKLCRAACLRPFLCGLPDGAITTFTEPVGGAYQPVSSPCVMITHRSAK